MFQNELRWNAMRAGGSDRGWGNECGRVAAKAGQIPQQAIVILVWRDRKAILEIALMVELIFC